MSNKPDAIETSVSNSHAEHITALLTAPDALDAYLSDVKRRREANRVERRRNYLQESVLRLTDELVAADADGDSHICSELRAVIRAFSDALEELSVSPSPLGSDLSADAQGAADGLPQAPELIATAETNDRTSASTEPDTLGEAIPPPLSLPLPVEPTKPIARQIDQDERQHVLGEIDELRGQIRDHLYDGGRELADAMQTRVLFCKGMSLRSDPNVESDDLQAFEMDLDELATTRSPWMGYFPFELTDRNTVFWADLADRYTDSVIAVEAIAWYVDNQSELDMNGRTPLVNAIAGAQQILYRYGVVENRKDQAVNELYNLIRSVSEDAGWLSSLKPDTTDGELIRLAATIRYAFERCKTSLDDRQTQAQRAILKDEAIQKVVDWEDSLEGRPITADSLASDRLKLCTLLNECLAAGVPPTNVKIRAAILDTAPVILEGQPRYSKFLDAVQAERSRRKLEAVELEEADSNGKDHDLDELVASVSEFTRGKKILMLGGKKRAQVAEELKRVLKCDVTWHDSDRGDKPSKFASALKRADVVLLLKNFASHELFYASKDAMSGSDKHFVVLPSGYGIKMVVHQLSNYVAREKVA